ncbi:hypothetical protein IE53DRAFT_250403 [Violaceomyces palustris]|uniref:Uncharacterized protein n=1 Tax=Violaceomyces palustris TaxID=1673888 RepID=A0ACD0P3Y4_9BASI|nr:hypothetical protein IE53DRAFT_250403 [Violaceomyces palustris]
MTRRGRERERARAIDRGERSSGPRSEEGRQGLSACVSTCIRPQVLPPTCPSPFLQPSLFTISTNENSIHFLIFHFHVALLLHLLVLLPDKLLRDPSMDVSLPSLELQVGMRDRFWSGG